MCGVRIGIRVVCAALQKKEMPFCYIYIANLHGCSG